MAQAAPYIMIALTAYSVHQQQLQARRADKIGKLNAEFKKEETQETVRRAKLEAARRLSLAKATQAASGFFGESYDLYLEELDKADQDQIRWLQKAGESQARIIAEGGSAQAGAISTSSFGTAMQGFGSAYSMYSYTKAA